MLLKIVLLAYSRGIVSARDMAAACRDIVQFKGTQRDCENCPLRVQCLRHPQRTQIRQVAIFRGKHAKAEETATERM